MQHVAIDLGGSKSQVCVRDESGSVLDERVVATNRIGAYLKRRPPSMVILETCSEAFSVATEARALGHEIRVIPATLVRALGVGDRGVKSDIRDARNISAASCRVDLPSVHVPSVMAREMRAACTAREALVHSRTELINCVRGQLRTRRLSGGRGSPTTFAARVRAALTEDPGGMPAYVERILLAVEALNVQIQAADDEIRGQAKADDTCRLLMTMPGVGPVTAVRFRAAVDDITRFGSAHELESYLGLTPGERSSSATLRRTSITKAGSSRVRWALCQAAWVAWRRRPSEPMIQWAGRIATRRSTKIAIVALMRKMAGILFAMWRDGVPYNPKLGAKAAEPEA